MVAQLDQKYFWENVLCTDETKGNHNKHHHVDMQE